MMMDQASGSFSEWYREGTYTLYSVRLSDKNDSNNTITYKASGRTEYYDRDYESNLNGQHTFDFGDITVTFSKQEEVQTDWTPPELTSLITEEIEVAQNQKFNINYSAFDADSELNDIRFILETKINSLNWAITMMMGSRPDSFMIGIRRESYTRLHSFIRPNQ